MNWCNIPHSPQSSRFIFTVVFNVLVLIGFNQVFKRFLPRVALSQGELLGHLRHVIRRISHCGTQHDGDFSFHVGTRFLVRNARERLERPVLAVYSGVGLLWRIRAFFRATTRGDSTLHTKQHLLGWLTPVLNWFAFLFVMLFCYGLHYCHCAETVDGR